MFWAVGVAASFMLAAAFGALWYATRADLGATRENIARLEAMVLERDRQLSAASQETAWIKDPRAAVALLKGPEAPSHARAWLLFNPGTKQALIRVSGLPPLPPGKAYALWAFAGDKPLAAGTLDVKGDAAAVLALQRQEAFAAEPTRFAVTVEVAGGVPAPAGEVVLAGETFPPVP
jgi:anti-sigma-K factor RskA